MSNLAIIGRPSALQGANVAGVGRMPLDEAVALEKSAEQVRLALGWTEQQASDYINDPANAQGGWVKDLHAYINNPPPYSPPENVSLTVEQQNFFNTGADLLLPKNDLDRAANLVSFNNENSIQTSLVNLNEAPSGNYSFDSDSIVIGSPEGGSTYSFTSSGCYFGMSAQGNDNVNVDGDGLVFIISTYSPTTVEIQGNQNEIFLDTEYKSNNTYEIHGDSNLIFGGSGNETFNVVGDGNTVDAGGGNDNITVDGDSSENQIFTGDGRDSVVVGDAEGTGEGNKVFVDMGFSVDDLGVTSVAYYGGEEDVHLVSGHGQTRYQQDQDDSITYMSGTEVFDGTDFGDQIDVNDTYIEIPKNQKNDE